MKTGSGVMLEAARDIIRKSNLQTLLLYVDGLEDLGELELIDFSGPLQVILVARDNKGYKEARKYTNKVVRLPAVNLTRVSMIKMAMMLSFSMENP